MYQEAWYVLRLSAFMVAHKCVWQEECYDGKCFVGVTMALVRPVQGTAVSS